MPDNVSPAFANATTPSPAPEPTIQPEFSAAHAGPREPIASPQPGQHHRPSPSLVEDVHTQHDDGARRRNRYLDQLSTGQIAREATPPDREFNWLAKQGLSAEDQALVAAAHAKTLNWFIERLHARQQDRSQGQGV
jgi:hypothetical protein